MSAPIQHLEPRILLAAYAAGVFPMAEGRDTAEIFWVEPRARTVLPLDGFHLSRSLRRTLRRDRFHLTRDTAFSDVMAGCADREETWINPTIELGYRRLHEAGHAHSIECWREGRLVGGLYGVRLGGAFFGESMFSAEADASKVALAWLVARLRVGGFRLLDCQFMTSHLASLGAIEIGRDAYQAVLSDAVSVGLDGAASRPDWGALDPLAAGAPSPGCVIAQLLGQTS